MTPEPSVDTFLAGVYREDAGRVLAALIAQLRDFSLAEDALQDASSEALIAWRRDGLPANGAAWLMTVARRRAIDRLRRIAVRNAPENIQFILDDLEQKSAEPEDEQIIPGERLGLIFTCCNPALNQEAQVALTLRTLCGLSTREIARAFLVPETTMAQRLVRAKNKIRKAGIPLRCRRLPLSPSGWKGSWRLSISSLTKDTPQLMAVVRPAPIFAKKRSVSVDYYMV